jgi:hypothetical protein
MSAPIRTEQRSLAELEAELKDAIKAHFYAAQQSALARNEECSALNRLNAAQKAIDAAVDSHRTSAHSDSDWSRREYGREAVVREAKS